MKNKKYLWIIFLILILISTFSSAVMAYTTTVSSEGLPYNEYDKYSYFVRDVSKYDYGTIPSMTIPIHINVRDKKTSKILSSDTITLTFDGIPQSREIASASGGQMTFGANARFDFNINLANVSSQQEIEKLWEEKAAGYSGAEKTTLFGRPALKVTNSNTSEDYVVYLDDVKLPNGIAYFNVYISGSINLGALKDTTQGREFQKTYEDQAVAVFQELKEQFNKMTIKVDKVCNVRSYEEDKDSAGPVAVTVDTDASSESGETDTTVPAAVVIGLVGAAAAAVGTAAGVSGAAAGGSSKINGEEGTSTYKMVINKDFGDKIRYNGEEVFIYARMVEVNAEGVDIERPDLTEQIEIFSDDSCMEVGTAIMSGDYMGASVNAYAENVNSMPTEGIISFRFIGEGGTFQNNVKFKMIGKPYVALDGPNLFVLSASGNSYELAYELKDFLDEAKVTVNTMQDIHPFDLKLDKDKEGNPVIIATDREEKKPIERFFNSFSCEIIAENEKEYARTIFDVVMCYEGVLPDFLGKEKEIIAYRNEEDEMPITNIAFRLGVWNENDKNLDLKRPEEIQVEFTDEEKIFEVIGLEETIDLENSTDDYLLYAFQAEKSLPSINPVVGTLSVIYNKDDLTFASETEVKLMPDLLSYEKDREKEYENCIRIIDTYMPTRFRAQKHKQLNAGYDKMGLQDLQLFRKKCWEIASRSIMQEKESYLIESYWYDEAIATAELVVYVGDVALDVALAPFGGPITGFVVTQVKAALLELISMRIEKGSIGYNEIYDLIMKRLEQGAGQADGLIETPGFDKPKVLVAWLSSYILYRIMYRWYFDLDENKNPKGLYAAIENGLMDFAGKGASILLGEFAKGIAKKRGIDVGSTADKEQEWVNEQVENAAKKGLDAMDSVAETLDKKIEEIIATIADYIDRIKSGGIKFT